MLIPKNDKELTRWLHEHPAGYVLHTRRSANPRYMVLHRASCFMIRPKLGTALGSATQFGYRKVCADDVSELQDWVRRHGRLDGSFSSRCRRCRP
jgi:hypothetical protein